MTTSEDLMVVLFSLVICGPALAASAGEADTHLWDREPPLWEAARKVTITQDIEANRPPWGPMWKLPITERVAASNHGALLGNYQMKVALWGPPQQLTLSLRKTDVFDRRFATGPFPTIEEIRKGAFDERNAEKGLGGRGGYPSPKGGRIVYQAWDAYEFPVAKDVGQAILFLPDFQGATQPQAVTRCNDGTTRIRLRNGKAETDLTYLTMMPQNIIAIHAECRGLNSAASVRLYRYRDSIVPGRKPKVYDYSKDAAWNRPMDPPQSGKDGRFFWVRQKLPAERTFPKGFEYVLMGLISGQSAHLETAADKKGLGTPGGDVSGFPGSAATAVLPGRGNISFMTLVTVVTTSDGGDLLGTAKRRLLKAEQEGMPGLVAENAAWYKEFYKQRENGRAFSGDPSLAAKKVPEIFHSWVFAHGLGGKPDPTRFECDSWNANVFETQNGAWKGIPCYNEIYFTPLHVMNRSDTLEYYPKLVKLWLAAGKRNARAVFDLPGMFAPAHGYVPPIDPKGPYPHTISTWEFCMEIPAQVMKVGWDTFDYGGDVEYLAETVYPPLRELAIFYAAYLKKGDDGRYHVVPTVSAEHWGWTYRFKGNRDGTAALAMFKWTLRRAAEASEILGVDADLRDRWRRIAEQIAPYPTWPTKDGTVFTDIAGVDPIGVNYNCFGGVTPALLADDINLDSDPKEIETMLRTARLVKGWIHTRVFHLLGRDKNVMHHHWPTYAWHVKEAPLPLVNRDNLMIAALLEPERLVNSRSGWIHLFACVPQGSERRRASPFFPDDTTIAFRRMQARGGFAVTAEMIEGAVTYVLIEARRDNLCRLVNPWPEPVRLYRNGRKAEKLSGPRLQFGMTKGERVELRKARLELHEGANPGNTVAGLSYEYYEGSWNALPDFDRLTPKKTGTARNFDISVRNRDHGYGLRFTGYLDVALDGAYTFYTTSDDGSKLFVGSKEVTQVVDNDGIHAGRERSGVFGLKAGKHAITVVFFQGGGGQGIQVRYNGPGIEKQEIPAARLSRVPGRR